MEDFVKLKVSTSLGLEHGLKTWILAVQWAMWNAINEAILKGASLNPVQIILKAKKKTLHPMAPSDTNNLKLCAITPHSQPIVSDDEIQIFINASSSNIKREREREKGKDGKKA